MATVLKLGFKDNPTVGSDDCIDLISASTSTGYHLKAGMSYGTPKLDPTINRVVRTLTLPLEIRGGSMDDANSKLRELYRYIEQTELYFARFGGNLPARSDGAWHQGNAAVLTEQPSGATYQVYWNVLGGDVAVSGPLEDTGIANTLYNVTLSLIVEGAARGARAILENMVACGDFAPPFLYSSSALNGSWTFTGTWSQGTDTTNRYYWYISAGPSCTALSNEIGVDIGGGYELLYLTGPDKVLPRISINVATKPSSGTLSCVLEIYNGASWSTQQTLFSITSGSSISTNTWLHYSGTAYTIATGITKVRLNINTGSASTSVKIAGAAIWRNPASDAEPGEFVAGGRTVGVPYFNVYNVQGDTAAPCVLNLNRVPSGTQDERILAIGKNTVNPSVDKPIWGLDYKTTSSVSSATTLFWGVLGTVSTGAATSSTYNVNSTRLLDRRVRGYRLFMAYAANDSAGITAVTVGVSAGINAETKTYTTTVPQTYTGNTTPVEANYRLFELGDFLFSRPGFPFIDGSASLTNTNYARVTLTHSNSANRQTAVLGVLFIPIDDYAAGDVYGTLPTSGGSLSVSSEGQSLRGAMFSRTSPTSFGEVSALNSSNYLRGTRFMLNPQQNVSSGLYTIEHFEILAAQARDSTYPNLITYDATDRMAVSIEYSPRYALGVR